MNSGLLFSIDAGLLERRVPVNVPIPRPAPFLLNKAKLKSKLAAQSRHLSPPGISTVQYFLFQIHVQSRILRLIKNFSGRMALFSEDLRVSQVGEAIEHGGKMQRLCLIWAPAKPRRTGAGLLSAQSGQRYNGEKMIKVFTFLTVLLIAATGVSAQTERDSKRNVKDVSYKTASPRRSEDGVVEIGPRSTYLKEGLSLAAVLHVMGKPDAVKERTLDGKTVTSYEFSRGAGRTVIADFIGGVLIHSQTVTVDEVPRVAG